MPESLAFTTAVSLFPVLNGESNDAVHFNDIPDILSKMEDPLSFCLNTLNQYTMHNGLIQVNVRLMPDKQVTVHIRRSDRAILLKVMRESLALLCPENKSEFVEAHEYLADWQFHWHSCTINAAACIEALIWIEFSDVYPVNQLSYSTLSYVYAWMSMLIYAKGVFWMASALMTEKEFDSVRDLPDYPCEVEYPLMSMLSHSEAVDAWAVLLTNSSTFRRSWVYLAQWSSRRLTELVNEDPANLFEVFNELRNLLSFYHGKRLAKRSPWRCILDWYSRPAPSSEDEVKSLPCWINAVCEDASLWDKSHAKCLRVLFFPFEELRDDDYYNLFLLEPESDAIQSFWQTYNVARLQKAAFYLSSMNYNRGNQSAPNVSSLLYKTMMFLIKKLPGYTKPVKNE